MDWKTIKDGNTPQIDLQNPQIHYQNPSGLPYRNSNTNSKVHMEFQGTQNIQAILKRTTN